jgi:hypothetical protein
MDHHHRILPSGGHYDLHVEVGLLEQAKRVGLVQSNEEGIGLARQRDLDRVSRTGAVA